MRYCWIFLFFLLATNIFSQKDSSVNHNISNHHSNKKLFHFEKWSAPKKASVMSAIIPGAGQIYNKKYWKVPIIYGLGGWLVFNTIKQNQNYFYYKSELLKVLNGGINADGLSTQQLTLLKNQSKKWRDLSIAGIALVYVINIIDANVDAHLKTFDISDNLSLQIYPNIKNFGMVTDSYYPYQVTLRLKWK